MEEFGFVNQLVESVTKPVEKLEVVVEDILNLVDIGMEISFHDQLVEFDMDIVEHSVMDDLVVVSDDLYVAKHLVMSNEMVGVESLGCVDGDLHISSTVNFVATSVDSLVADVDEGFLMKYYVQFVPGSEHADWIVEILV